MASRWMNQMKARQRAFNRRQGQISLTDREKKFYRPKFGESVDKHLIRMLQEAMGERVRPTEWWRRLARVLQVIEAPLHTDERKLIINAIRKGYTVEQTELSIMRYRRLTGYQPPPNPYTETEEDVYNRLSM